MSQFTSASRQSAEAAHRHVARALAQVEAVLVESCSHVLGVVDASGGARAAIKQSAKQAMKNWSEVLRALGVDRHVTELGFALEQQSQSQTPRGALARAVAKLLRYRVTGKRMSRETDDESGGDGAEEALEAEASAFLQSVTDGKRRRVGPPSWAAEYVAAGGSMSYFDDSDDESGNGRAAGAGGAREEGAEDDAPGDNARPPAPKLLKGKTLMSSVVPLVVGMSRDSSEYQVCGRAGCGSGLTVCTHSSGARCDEWCVCPSYAFLVSSRRRSSRGSGT